MACAGGRVEVIISPLPLLIFFLEKLLLGVQLFSYCPLLKIKTQKYEVGIKDKYIMDYKNKII